MDSHHHNIDLKPLYEFYLQARFSNNPPSSLGIKRAIAVLIKEAGKNYKKFGLRDKLKFICWKNALSGVSAKL